MIWWWVMSYLRRFSKRAVALCHFSVASISVLNDFLNSFSNFWLKSEFSVAGKLLLIFGFTAGHWIGWNAVVWPGTKKWHPLTNASTWIRSICEMVLYTLYNSTAEMKFCVVTKLSIVKTVTVSKIINNAARFLIAILNLRISSTQHVLVIDIFWHESKSVCYAFSNRINNSW